MRKLLLLVLIFTYTFSFGQHTHKCGINYFDSIEVAKNPEILKKRQALEAFTQSYIKQKSKNNERLVIPIVFHVLHDYGPEWIDADRINTAIEIINRDFNAENSDLSTVIGEFKSIIGNTNIEFRLAKIDPEGNPTTGINYYHTDLTYNATNALKYEIRNWAPQKYLNVWSVRSIESNAAAWSHYPGISSALDGVVSIYKYIGSGHTLTHEIGHYLNLAHPWGSTNEPGKEENCDMDDNVEDTPNTIGADQNCNFNQESCGSLDNVQNIMEYSTCDAMLTIGQTERMRAALNSTISSRNNLWSETNLIETGTIDGFVDIGTAPVADFKDEARTICPGDVVAFKDYSSGGYATEWEWTFEGGEPSTSTLQNPDVVYNTPGAYNVSLTAKNDQGESTVTREEIVVVIDPNYGIIAPTVVTMEDENFPFYPNDPLLKWSVRKESDDEWELFVGEENNAMRINNTAGGVLKNSLITSNIDISGIDNPDYIYFDLAYAQKTSTSHVELKAFISIDCGTTWLMRFYKSGKSLSTTGGEYVRSDFVPEAGQWEQMKIDISTFKDVEHLLVKFESSGDNGNFLYIDNLSVGNVSSVKNINDAKYLKVYPNPANHKITINYTPINNSEFNIQIANVFGKIVWSKNYLNINTPINESLMIPELRIKPGVYFISVVSQNHKFTRPIVLTR